MNLADEPGHKRTDPAGKDINNGVFNLVGADIVTAVLQGSYIIVDGLRRADIWHLEVETPGIVIFRFPVLGVFAGYVVF